MSKVQAIADPDYVHNQYQTASHLNTRIRLHQRFSTNKYGWQRWLFDQFKLMPHSRILEVGCGTAKLWFENLDRIPAELEIILSDLSKGMLEQARQSLQNKLSFFQFNALDAQSIPFGDASFDIVIACHMLYHVPDRRKAISEIKRVLKPAGRFYASTGGCHHLKELCDLVSRFDPQLSTWSKLTSETFSLENAPAQLRQHFANVSLYRYPNSLIVTDANLLTEYILSGRITLSSDQQVDLARFVERELKANDGRFFISMDTGIFESNNILQP